ncbi:hypothetical protein [Rhizobium sp. BK176]|uniref:hypothetical protein n=1 Tax=Rhizobium sp. BK176 TaxID=2587071 RepID=UPI00216A52C8|nr:hypothetical protein [Rhizobium sp. BK176]MCS4090236.1 hypothetical protein [Rhizobium sp. BK176]
MPAAAVEQARFYLGAHKRHARQGGISAFAELVRASVTKFAPVRRGANGRTIIYDEFHRSAR